MEIFFAVVLILQIDGTEKLLPVSYTNTLQECKVRADRISQLAQLHKSNIVGAGCKEMFLNYANKEST